jgi:hypothetical protein
MLKTKPLYLTLIATGIIAAIIGLVQMWTEMISGELFSKSMISLVVVGITSAFLMAIQYDVSSGKSRILLISVVVLGLTFAALCLLQLWIAPFEAALFTKLLLTLIIVFGLLAFVMAVKEDFGSEKKMRDDHYLD